MKWFDFSDTNFLIFFIVVAVVIIATIVFTITFIISHNRDIRYSNRIKEESNTLRVYSIDVKNNLVTYFNRSDIRHKHSVTLADFYSRFHPNDVDRVKGWIFDINFGNPVEEYLEVDVLLHRGKDSYFSLLKLLKTNPKNGVIRVESIILKYITPLNLSNKRKKRGTNAGVVKRSQMASIINKRISLSGYSFCIRLFYLRQKVLSNDKIERYMTMTMKNEIYPFIANTKLNRQIVDINESEMMLFDLRIDSKEAALHLANSISHSLKKCLSVNGFSDSINFGIGVVSNSQFYQDFDAIVNNAEAACISAQQNNADIYLYQKSVTSQNELSKYKKEVEHLLDKDVLRYLFRPLIDVKRRSILGYFQYVRAYDSPFSSYGEMSKYAALVGKNRELFSLIAKTVVPKFASEAHNDELRLFLNVSMLDLDQIWEILPNVVHFKTIHTVLVFDEQEVNENSKDIDLLNKAMQNLKDASFELALMLKDKNLLLDPSVYFNFDYFIAGSAMIGEIKKNNRIRLSIHTLIEQLLAYKKPIIATDLESWQAIELILKSGISMISSEVISASNDMLLPLEKKKTDKLSLMWDKYK